MEETQRAYRFLDTEADRLALIEDIHRVRRDLLKVANLVPKERWYEPRYHGWSLAAMLGHLQLMDRLLLWLLSLGVIGVKTPLSRQNLDIFNDVMAQVYKRRVVNTTLRGLEGGEKRITDFILRLPMDKLSKSVYDPAQETTLTVEQGIQEFFLVHWQEHLQTLRLADDLHYEPPKNTPT